MINYFVIPRIRFLLAFTCMLVSPLVYADEAADQAEAFFNQKEYDKALTIWYKMIESGETSTGIFYNIGLAESQLRNTPKAILALEKAARLKPMNKAVQSAITEERKKIQNATIPVEPFFLNEWYKAVVTFLRPGYWSFIGLSLIGIGMVSMLSAGPRSKTEDGPVHRFKIPLIILGACFVLMGWLSYREIYRENEAIIAVSCEVRQAPAGDSPATRSLSPGEKIIMTDSIGEWYHVQLLNLDAGWLKKNCLIPIVIDHR
jgi:tetratricopeptide (TPR) repeat protein